MIFSSRVMVPAKRVASSLPTDYREYLFGKIGVALPEDHHWNRATLDDSLERLNENDDAAIVDLATDLLVNRQYYRGGVNPRYDFDVPFRDLERFLGMDGWALTENGQLQKAEAGVINIQEEEDRLLQRLRASGLPNVGLIETHLSRAAEEYGQDNNNSMTNARQALEQLLDDIAHESARQRNEHVIGQVRDYLHNIGFLTEEEKRGFSGAYGFLSGGPHPGIIDQEAARLGRNFSLGTCQYALEKWERWAASGCRRF